MNILNDVTAAPFSVSFSQPPAVKKDTENGAPGIFFWFFLFCNGFSTLSLHVQHKLHCGRNGRHKMLRPSLNTRARKFTPQACNDNPPWFKSSLALLYNFCQNHFLMCKHCFKIITFILY